MYKYCCRLFDGLLEVTFYCLLFVVAAAAAVD